MGDELNYTDVRNDSDEAAAKRDIHRLELRMESIEKTMLAIKQEILDHFDASIEHIEDEMKSANRDEIELMKDVQQRHGQRIAHLESSLGA